MNKLKELYDWTFNAAIGTGVLLTVIFLNIVRVFDDDLLFWGVSTGMFIVSLCYLISGLKRRKIFLKKYKLI